MRPETKAKRPEVYLRIYLSDMLWAKKCYEIVRQVRWPDGVVVCPFCGSVHITKNGHDIGQTEKQDYHCSDCHKYFDDLTMTIFAGRHRPLEIWISCLYLMGLNLSNRQIAKELDLAVSDVHSMTTELRQGIVQKHQPEKLSGVVEFDEVYVIAGHKGNPDAVDASGREPRRRRLKGSPGRGTLDKDKPPILGMIQRNGCILVRMLPNVKRETIEPIIRSNVVVGSMVCTDEYVIYDQLPEWGYEHKTVNHGNKEYARDEDGDGFCEVHVNTAEGFWSLLRSWFRPHRGISQEKLPIYLSFFEFVHNARKRGKALLTSLLGALLA